jgi:hypothetical protein
MSPLAGRANSQLVQRRERTTARLFRVSHAVRLKLEFRRLARLAGDLEEPFGVATPVRQADEDQPYSQRGRNGRGRAGYDCSYRARELTPRHFS